MLTSALPNDDVVLATLTGLLAARASRPVTSPMSVVDLGGGTGVYAVPLAAQGHRVEVLDQSADALATLRRRAEAAGVTDLVTARTADLDALDGALSDRAADLVLCHRVLEYVADPARTLASARAALGLDGYLSVLVASRSGAALSHLIAGRFDEATAALDPATSAVQRRFELLEVDDVLAGEGLQIERALGVGLIGELNPAQAQAPAARAIEERLATHEELRAVAPLLHVIARPVA